MQFDDPDYQLPIEKAIGLIAKELILKRSGEGRYVNPGVLPVFSYQLKTRDAAARLLAPALGLLPDWSFDNLRSVTNELKRLMRTHAGSETGGSVDLGALTREQRQWILEQNRIVSTLTRVRGIVRVLNPKPKN